MNQQNEAAAGESKVVVELTDECVAVLNQQAQIVSMENNISRVTTAMDEQKAIIKRLKADLPDVESMNREFDELLARHVTGDATERDVADYQARIDAVNASLGETAPKIEMAERTLNALTRKGEALVQEALKLKRDKADLVKRFLIAEAQAECQRYVEAAAAVDKSYRRLLSLDSMLIRCGHSRLHAHAKRMFIPRFNLDPCDAVASPLHVHEALFAVDERFEREKLIAAMGDEYQALQETFGIEFDD